MIMFAVLYIPHFGLQAVLRHEPELWVRPVALVDPAQSTPVIWDMTEAARLAGITLGSTPTQAMARCPTVTVRPRSPGQEEAAMVALLQCAYAFSPHLEATGPGVCTLDLNRLAVVSSSDKPGLIKWGKALQEALSQVGLSVAIGIGQTPNVARHAARWGQGIEVVEDAAAFISGLPVKALEPSDEVAQIIKGWGIRTVGELLALGQEALSARLGLESLALLGAASCTAVRPLHLVGPPERFEESFEFNPEIENLEPLLFVLRRFVDGFSPRLELRGLVAEGLVLTFTLESGQKLVCRLRIPQPTRQADVLFRTLHTYLETLRTDSAIKTVKLSVRPVQAGQKQLGLFDTVLPDPHRFQETLARLAAVLGPDQVGTPALENSHRPDAFQMVNPDFENAPALDEQDRSSPMQMAPLRRFRPPVKAEVEVECEPTPQSQPPRLAATGPSAAGFKRPLSIRCSVVNGRLSITLGPWRGSGHWWEPSNWEREEWDAATSDGRVIRLVHQPDGWFVEGVVD